MSLCMFLHKKKVWKEVKVWNVGVVKPVFKDMCACASRETAVLKEIDEIYGSGTIETIPSTIVTRGQLLYGLIQHSLNFFSPSNGN